MPKICLHRFMFFLLENFENIFPEKSIEVKYKNRHSWMPNSLLNHQLKQIMLFINSPSPDLQK